MTSRRSGSSNVSIEQIPDIILVSPLLTMNK